jgi:two-component sensor histidine kinase
VTADDTRYGATTGTLLPPNTSRIRIDYTVVNTSQLDQTAAAGVTPARIRFRYRLDGFDTDWIEGSGPRQAVYMNLAPRQYRFRLQVAGDAAVWEDAETTLSFSIRPMFYETGWFRGLCVLAILLGAVASWSLRVRHLRRQFDVVFAERMRLSREIHDTLLQGMYGVALQVNAAAEHVAPSSPTLPLLQRVQRQIEDYIAESRQSLLNLRSERVEEADLVEALRATGDRLTAGQVPFVMNVTGTPRPCSPKVEKQVLRIGREAIMNAVRHSKARQIRVDVAFEDRLLHLRVADDGCGFNPADIDGHAHYGLLSMRERATDAGGRCIVESHPGAGVQVVAQFPILTSETP